MSESEQAVAEATARINWRRLLLPTLFVMVLPTLSAFVMDKLLGSLPLITIAAILICFPLASFLVIRSALQEMDRVIAEVAPLPQEPLPPEPQPDDVQAGVEYDPATQMPFAQAAVEIDPEVEAEQPEAPTAPYMPAVPPEMETRVESLPKP